jgi:hypothetical protein
MEVIWPILLQFIFRLSLGMAAAMALTPSRWVTAGFYRIHLWVVLGLNTFAVLIAWSRPTEWPSRRVVLMLAAAIAATAYLGAVIWLYEKRRAGLAALWLVAGLSLAAAAISAGIANMSGAALLAVFDLLTSSLLLGATITAMFLGHWYLNNPGMQLAPLRRLVLFMAAAVFLRAIAGAAGLSLEAFGAEKALAWWLMVSLRWIAGLVLPLVLAWLTWQTLKIPNTQSATGILYAAVILTFIGELTSQLLSADAVYPL